MKITLWDGQSDVQGIPASHLHDAYPLPDGGSLALVWSDDEERLLQVADRRPVGGFLPITADDVDELFAALEAAQTPPAPDPANDPVTREEFNELLTMFLEA